MDQASQLRQLVRRDAAHVRDGSADEPQLMAVASGKGGVGTTTIAVNLAISLARLGRRVVLVDADLEGADVARLCQSNPEYCIADVLKGERDVHEVLCPAPGGIHLLPGAWLGETVGQCTPKAQERLIRALRDLGSHADDVVLDVGCGAGRVNRYFWHAADKVLLVATPDDAAVMNAYAATKIICSDDKRLPLYTLVNFACDEQGARSVHERLSQACRRFLGFDLMPAGHVPASDEVRQAARACQPFVLASPHCAATVEIEAVAQQLIAVRSEPKAPHMLEHRWQQALVSEQVVGMRS